MNYLYHYYWAISNWTIFTTESKMEALINYFGLHLAQFNKKGTSCRYKKKFRGIKKNHFNLLRLQ